VLSGQRSLVTLVGGQSIEPRKEREKSQSGAAAFRSFIQRSILIWTPGPRLRELDRRAQAGVRDSAMMANGKPLEPALKRSAYMKPTRPPHRKVRIARKKESRKKKKAWARGKTLEVRAGVHFQHLRATI